MSNSLIDRQQIMRLCGLASLSELEDAVEALAPLPAVTVLRPSETGLVMVEGRVGGDGARFNVGEATVTRAAVRLDSGETGLAYLLGQRPREAQLAATIDALWQRAEARPAIEAGFVAKVTERMAADRDRRRSEADATRVNFFTLERGENPA